MTKFEQYERLCEERDRLLDAAVAAMKGITRDEWLNLEIARAAQEAHAKTKKFYNENILGKQ